jgi:hypothetical protein
MRLISSMHLGYLSAVFAFASGCASPAPEATDVAEVEQALTLYCAGKANGTACNDYDPLTQNDTCQGGVCVPGAIPGSPRAASPDISNYPSTCVKAKTTYSVLVKTGDAANADTSAAVTLQLTGDTSSGRTTTATLQLGNGNLARNSKFFKSFSSVTSVGELAQLKLTQNKAGTSPSWLVDWVEVQDSCSGRRYRFDLHRWLGKDNAAEPLTSVTTPASTGGSVHKVKVRPVFLAPSDAVHTTATPNGNGILNVGVGYGRGCTANLDQNGYVEPVSGYGGPVTTSEWSDMIRVMKVVQNQWEKLLGVAAGKAFELDIPPTPMVVSCRNDAYLTAVSFNHLADELLKIEGSDRYDSNTIFVIVYWRPIGANPYYSAGGRPFNGAPGTGGGGLFFDFYDFRYDPGFLSTLTHELGHTMGLTHVDAYGLDMNTNDSVMSYNPAHHSIDKFTPSATPGIILDVERAKLVANKDVLPFYTIDAATMARGQATTGYTTNLGPMAAPLSEVDGQGYRILDANNNVISGPDAATYTLSDAVYNCQNPMGFDQTYTYQFNSASYRRICKGYELYFNGQRVGYEKTWGMGAGIDNCIWNLVNNPTLNPTCYFNDVSITAYAQTVRATPNTSANLFEYDKRIVYQIPFSPTATRCSAIGASTQQNLFACFLGTAHVW